MVLATGEPAPQLAIPAWFQQRSARDTGGRAMDKYVDGFLLPLAKDKLEQYKKMAKAAGEVWKEHGALEYFECIADELEHEEMVSFKQSAGASEEETVILSWIIYESKEHRDKVNAAVMDDPRIKEMMEKDPPFDSKRMAYGGFKSLVTFSTIRGSEDAKRD
jgi:uncharacterized protein YbaA (DUF1428 family)